MNDREVINLLAFSQEHKNVLVGIYVFSKIIKEKDLIPLIDITSDADFLKQGLFGYIGACRIFVDMGIKTNIIKYSDSEDPSMFNKRDWSVEFDLNSNPLDIDRINNLKGFW